MPYQFGAVPWHATVGCSPAGPGCDRCRSAPTTHRLAGKGKAGGLPVQGLTRVRPDDRDRCEFTGEVRDADCAGATIAKSVLAKPRLVVVSPDSDLFHPQVSDASLLRAFRAMRATPMHTYLVLTKRPERLLDFSRRLVLADGFRGEYLTTSETRGRPYLPLAGHVRIGVSAENQDLFDARLAVLAQVRAARKFVAVEPMLGPVRLTAKQAVGLRWVLISGEEGKGGRVCQAEWIAALAADARARKVPAYVNQVGSFFWDGNEPVPVTGTAGTDMAEWPAAVRIREEFNDGDL